MDVLGFFSHSFVDGWTPFGGLVLFIIIGGFREWWAPGPAYRRAVTAAISADESLKLTLKQNTALIESNKISDYFYKNVLPVPRTRQKKLDLEDVD